MSEKLRSNVLSKDESPSNLIAPYSPTSGRYLITAIKHTVALETGTHEMTLQCMKDSVRTPYPIEEDALITGKDDINEVDIYKEDIANL